MWLIALGAGAGALLIGLAVATNGGTPADAVTPSATPSPSPDQPSPSPTPAPDALEGVTLDALQAEHIDELRDFALWLDENDAEGFVGEVGWPAADAGWTPLGEYWYALAEQEGLWTTAWAAGSHWGGGYPLVTYGSAGTGSLDSASPQARVLEELEAARVAGGSTPGPRHGVNVAGLEFGTSGGFSNASPGVLGTDYFAEPAASYAWLAARGVDLVRLPLRWERLQPTLGGAFDADHVAVVTAQLDAAGAAGIDVILDLHNYGAYAAEAGPVLLGSDALPGDRMTDVWLRISHTWGDHTAVLGYGLMNEPHDLPGDQDAAADAWESMSQRTVDALRQAGDRHLLLVAGYDWSSLARWRDTHPTGWIDDAAANFRYEAHHYWDRHGEGAYALPYADELAAAAG